VHGRFGQVRPIQTRSGNQIKFRRYESLSAATTPLVKACTPSGSQITTTDVTATLAQFGDYVNVTDMVDLTNQDAVLTEVGMVLGEQAGVTVDQVRRDVLVAGTNAIFTNGTVRTTLNTVLSSVALRTAIRFMGRQNGKYVRNIIKADTERRHGRDSRGVHRSGSSGHGSAARVDPRLHPGHGVLDAMQAEDDECGSYRNLRFFRSTNCKVFLAGGAAVGTDGMISAGATNNDVYATLIIAANAYGVCPLSGECAAEHHQADRLGGRC
jgi:hypothetical protein